MKKQDMIIIGFILIFLGIAVGFFLSEMDFCKTEQIRNESFADGYIKGLLFWNNVVIVTINNNEEIPYIINNTIQTLPIKQVCAGR